MPSLSLIFPIISLIDNEDLLRLGVGIWIFMGEILPFIVGVPLAWIIFRVWSLLNSPCRGFSPPASSWESLRKGDTLWQPVILLLDIYVVMGDSV